MPPEDTTEDTGGTTAGEKTIPYDRFSRVVAERNELKKKLAEVETQAQTAVERAATADTLAKQFEALKGELAAERADRETERAVWGAGISDPEGIDLVRYHHGKLPEKDRPPVADWLKSMREKPDSAPKSLRVFLDTGTSSSTKAAETTTKATDQAAAGKASGLGKSGGHAAGTTTTASTGEPMSAEALRQIRSKAQQTGDWSEWKRVTGKT